MSTRSMYEADQARLSLRESLRIGESFVVSDIRQAGERLSADFPAIEIIDGTGGAPDQIVVRRALHSTVLRSCRLVPGVVPHKIYIAELVTTPVPPGCVPVPDTDSDGWADNHGAWNQRPGIRGGWLHSRVRTVGGRKRLLRCL